MIGIDTNLLVRYLTKDNEEQWQKATFILQSGETCFIANIVLCELVWVLRGKPYQYPKQDILSTVESILQSPVFEFENRPLVYQALRRTQKGKADFSDYLIGAICQNAGCEKIATFDRKLNTESSFDLMD